MQKFKQLFFQSLMALALAVSAAGFAVVPAFAQTPQQQACQAINGNSACNTPAGPNLTKTMHTVVNILSIILGIIAVIMIIISGLKYVTSGGDASSVSSAKNTLIYSLVGLVVAAMAQFFARYILVSLK